MESRVKRIAFVGNYLPRQCGIATFTTDLCEAVAHSGEDKSVLAIPMNDKPEGYHYPDRVQFEVAERELDSYRRAADFLNINDIDIVCLQHEFGIYGGPSGSHIIAMLEDLRMPVVTTLHTVIDKPNANQRKVMDDLARLSDRLVLMSERGASMLQTIYRIPAEKISMIHHGIPDVPFVDPNFYKDKFGVEQQWTLLTFGLLAPNKGLEYVIQALPRVLEKHPNVVYIVLGATHPNLKRKEGETYRLGLQSLAQQQGVEGNVIFLNRFVSLEELIEFIGAADVYITPYLNEAQIVSGTLAYSVGAGKAVISTPYWYAQEILNDGRGMLIPFRDPEAAADAVLYMLDNEAERHAMRRRAYQLGREMIWSVVAKRYLEVFEQSRDERYTKPRTGPVVKTLEKRRGELPPLKLDHILNLTDDTGMLQHAIFSVPNYDEGYTTDDNARALCLAVMLEEQAEPATTLARRLMGRYLAFLNHAFNPETQRFRNFLSYDRRWTEDIGSEDSHCRALWALGATAGRAKSPDVRGLAIRLFDETLPAALEFQSPRSWAFALLGIMEFMRRLYGHRAAQDARLSFAERLLALYNKTASDEWPWFEDRLSYSNARLPHALLLCGHWLGRSDMVDAALRSLRFLCDVQTIDGHFVPVGCNGWYRRGRERARFDQQPIEGHATVSACLEAYRVTGEEQWWREAQKVFQWFLGRNDLNMALYNASTGGCYDGLTPDGVNFNQGAESTLAFLLSLMEMRQAEHVIKEPEPESE